MSLFAINGESFPRLPILELSPALTIVDTEGTGRTAAQGNPLFRDPAGAFWNLTIVLGGAVIDGQEEEFHRLVALLESYGKEGFHQVTFTTPRGVITQNMYCTTAEFSLRRCTRFGEVFWKPLSLKFIAERAYIS